MACTNCSTTDGGAPKGCNNNGSCGTDSCNKLSVFDWLSNMTLPGGQAPFDAVEIRFKNGRKEFFRNTEKLTLSIGDIVATEASPGHDIGIITLTGELVKIQMKKKNENPDKGIMLTFDSLTIEEKEYYDLMVFIDPSNMNLFSPYLFKTIFDKN